MKLIDEQNPMVEELRARLNALHAKVYSTASMGEPSVIDYFWSHLLPDIRATIKRRGGCRVLEFGAGYSGFAKFLQREALRDRVELTLHDIFPNNTDWLTQQADSVVIGPATTIRGRYDYIVSSFVVEHMTDPTASLATLWSLLEPDGAIYLICPRYDLPLYLPPACDHLDSWQRFRLRLSILARRIQSLLTNTPAFLLLSDVAAFYLPHERDRDASHLVSLGDLRRFFAARGSKMERLRVTWLQRRRDLLTLGGLKAWFITRFLLVSIVARKFPALSH